MHAGGGRVDTPGDAQRVAREAAEAGSVAATVHVGGGLETPERVLELGRAVARAAEDTGVPIGIETHRATVTQDMWRTLWLIEQVPATAINADFSHWYTGLEMPYGDLDAKLAAMQPVFDRTVFMHGRIGDSGAMQVDIGPDVATAEALPHVQHFRRMWSGVFAAFKRQAGPGDVLPFAPELLHAGINYARRVPGPDGDLREEGDRWQQALLYVELAQRWFDAA
jgi:hypothetical protein